MNIALTTAAATRVAELIKKNDKGEIGLRVSVDGGGCSGLMYHYELSQQSKEDDLIIEKDGVKLLVDPISQPFLDGCQVDFIQELGASFFQVNNPNATAKCGCGNSFSI